MESLFWDEDCYAIAGSLRIKQMLNKTITAKTHLLHIGRVTMNIIFAAMKDYLKRLYNWFSNVMRKVRMEFFLVAPKYTRDKESKVVLFI